MEIERLTSLNALLMEAGFAEIIYSDFVESTIELLQKTIDAILNGLGDEFLAESFNDESVSSAIIMHFRVRLPLVLVIAFSSKARSFSCSDLAILI